VHGPATFDLTQCLPELATTGTGWLLRPQSVTLWSRITANATIGHPWRGVLTEYTDLQNQDRRCGCCCESDSEGRNDDESCSFSIAADQPMLWTLKAQPEHFINMSEQTSF